MPRMRRLTVCCTLAVCLLLTGVVTPRAHAQQVTDEQVEQTIERLQRDLLESITDEGNVRGDEEVRNPRPGLWWQDFIGGGETGLVVWALLESGVSQNREEIQRALRWLDRIEIHGTYGLTMRICAYAAAPGGQYRRSLMDDVRQLVNSVHVPPDRRGGWEEHYGAHNYHCPGTRENIWGDDSTFDHSNSQFAVLAAWQAHLAGIEIPSRFWELVERHWVSTQTNDGGWSYGGSQGTSYGSMTTAGLASLYVCIDTIHGQDFIQCGQNTDIPQVDAALQWLGRHWSPTNNFRLPGEQEGKCSAQYYLFCSERVGLASGYKYFGDHDWYREGASYLVNYPGSSEPDKALALLFLIRGRWPVLFNHIRYEGEWNNRPRGLASVTHWLGKTFERPVSWQIIDIDTPSAEWHDAPIALLTGHNPAEFSEEDLDTMRQFVEEGGTLMSIAECGRQGDGFDQSMREAYRQMFPQYELVELPLDHPIYNIQFQTRRPVKIEAISNGVRLLAIHTQHDFMRSFQMRAESTARAEYELAANMYFYVTDRGSLRNRGVAHWPVQTGAGGGPEVALAQVAHGGNWTCEPGAVRRLEILLHNQQAARLRLAEPTTPPALDADEVDLAWLAGASAFDLGPADVNALKCYVENGGTLLVEAIGGNENARQTGRDLIEAMFGRGALRPLASNAELYNLPGRAIEEVSYRRAAMGPGATREPRLMGVTVGDRIGVIYSGEDISAGLVGYQQHGLSGYEPDSAYQIMRNILLYAQQ